MPEATGTTDAVSPNWLSDILRRCGVLPQGRVVGLQQREGSAFKYRLVGRNRMRLLAKNATTLVTLQNARTQINIWRASVDSNTAQLENLNTQLSYCNIRAPITWRASSLRHDPEPNFGFNSRSAKSIT